MAARGILGGSDHILPEFLFSKETEAECGHTYTLDCRKTNFNALRTMIGKVPWHEILTVKGVQGGWEASSSISLFVFKVPALKVPDMKSINSSYKFNKPSYLQSSLMKDAASIVCRAMLKCCPSSSNVILAISYMEVPQKRP